MINEERRKGLKDEVKCKGSLAGPRFNICRCHLALGWALGLNDLHRSTQVLLGIHVFNDLEQFDSNSTHPGSSWTLFLFGTIMH